MSFIRPSSCLFGIVTLLVKYVVLKFNICYRILTSITVLPNRSFIHTIMRAYRQRFKDAGVTFSIAVAIVTTLLSFIFTGRLGKMHRKAVVTTLLIKFVTQLFNH